jgi:hypothetical protein
MLPCLACLIIIASVSAAVANGKAFRKGNLDYFDSATLRYYLGLEIDAGDLEQVQKSDSKQTAENYLMHSAPPILDYDVVILYFAQWDQNSQALAPMYDQIATMLHAAGGESLDTSSSSSIDPLVARQKKEQAAAASKKKMSPIIMALYDCEMDLESMILCNEVGITHYPTIQFISLTAQSHDAVEKQASAINKQKKRAQQRKRKASASQRHCPAHITVFGGNWQYGNAVLDWIQALSALQQYYRGGGVGSKIRAAVYRFWSQFLPFVSSPSTRSSLAKLPRTLPVGVPQEIVTRLTSETGSKFASGAATASGPPSYSEQEVKEVVKLLDQQIDRHVLLIDTMLFPRRLGKNESTTAQSITDPVAATMVNSLGTATDGQQSTLAWKNYSDVFAYLTATGGWSMDASRAAATSSYPVPVLVKTCVLDLSMDYCQRLSSHHLNDWIDSFDDERSITEADIDTYVSAQVVAMAQLEPYCGVLESCISSSAMFHSNSTCRPQVCPFMDSMACRYVTACLSSNMQQEYADALDKLDTTRPKHSAPSAPAADVGGSSKPKKAGWGVGR